MPGGGRVTKKAASRILLQAADTKRVAHTATLDLFVLTKGLFAHFLFLDPYNLFLKNVYTVYYCIFKS